MPHCIPSSLVDIYQRQKVRCTLESFFWVTRSLHSFSLEVFPRQNLPHFLSRANLCSENHWCWFTPLYIIIVDPPMQPHFMIPASNVSSRGNQGSIIAKEIDVLIRDSTSWISKNGPCPWCPVTQIDALHCPLTKRNHHNNSSIPKRDSLVLALRV